MTVRLDREACRRHMSAARVARLATVSRDGWPHLVPVTFALLTDQNGADRIVSAVDRKPKRTTDLRRLRNIAENPKVAVLADHYRDDWSQLWWVRADGRAATVFDGPDRNDAIASLRAKYQQYRAQPPSGPVIVIMVDSLIGWSYTSK